MCSTLIFPRYTVLSCSENWSMKMMQSWLFLYTYLFSPISRPCLEAFSCLYGRRLSPLIKNHCYVICYSCITLYYIIIVIFINIILFQDSLLSSLPYLALFIMGNTTAVVTDVARSKGWIKTGAVRKLTTGIGKYQLENKWMYKQCSKPSITDSCCFRWLWSVVYNNICVSTFLKWCHQIILQRYALNNVASLSSEGICMSYNLKEIP